MYEPNTLSPQAASAPLSFEFAWDAAEHRRLLRAITRHRERTTGERVFWWALSVLLVIPLVSVVVVAVERGSVGVAASFAPWLIILGFWIILFRWLTPWVGARQFRKQNPSVDHPIRLRVDDEGVHSEWESQSSLVKWSGVRRVVETEDFFLFYNSPLCALFLPTRAISTTAELETLRRRVHRAVRSRAQLLG